MVAQGDTIVPVSEHDDRKIQHHSCTVQPKYYVVVFHTVVYSHRNII